VGVAVGARIDVAATIGDRSREDRLDDTRSADRCVPRRTATFRVRVTTLVRVCVHLARAWTAVGTIGHLDRCPIVVAHAIHVWLLLDDFAHEVSVR
jgi:hypothetical protein